MAVHELRSQEAQHDSGVILRSAGREAVQLELDGRTLRLEIDRGVGRDLFYLPASPVWDDGTPMDPALAGRLPQIIGEIEEFWGSSAQFRILPAAR